ncbi:hypothetical protein Tco_0602248 [Tanacetum coccineum]
MQEDLSSLKSDTSEIKSMMIEIYQAFKGQSSTPSSSVPTTTLSITEGSANVGEDETKKDESDKAKEEPTRAVPISTIRPITRPNPEVALIEFSSRPPLTDPILKIHVPQQTALVIQREGKGIATDEQLESTKKVVPTSKGVREDPDEPIRVPYMINEKMHYLTNYGINAHLEKEDTIKKAVEEAKMFEMTKTEKKKNTIINDLMISLGKRYERLKKIPKELGIQSALPAPILKQAPSQSSGRKRKHMELEPEIKVPGLECDRSLPEGVPFMNNMVGIDSLVSYLVMASMIKTPKNARFSLKLNKLIAEHLDQKKLQSKKVKLEATGYKLD